MKSIHRMSIGAVGMAAIFALSVQAHNGRIQIVPTASAESERDERHAARCSAARLKGSFGFTTTGWIVAADQSAWSQTLACSRLMGWAASPRPRRSA